MILCIYSYIYIYTERESIIVLVGLSERTMRGEEGKRILESEKY
jgi:hypothetical protein